MNEHDPTPWIVEEVTVPTPEVLNDETAQAAQDEADRVSELFWTIQNNPRVPVDVLCRVAQPGDPEPPVGAVVIAFHSGRVYRRIVLEAFSGQTRWQALTPPGAITTLTWDEMVDITVMVVWLP